MEKPTRNIKGVTVVVIGGCGFLGSHLVNHLIDDRDCNVIVLDNLITGQKKFLHPKAKFIWCDITHSESQLIKIFKEHNVEYVFNYAAEPYIPVSFDRPLHVFDINARGALMVMNASQACGVKGILQVSSAEIYGDATNEEIKELKDLSIDENFPARPHSTYGASKLAIDMLVQARWKEAKTPCIALRQFNCIGERETHPYVVTTIIEQINKNPHTIKLGNNSIRDFQYAGDAVRMAVELLEKGNFGEVYNMGSGLEGTIKIYHLAFVIMELMTPRDSVLDFKVEKDPTRIRPWEIWSLCSNNTKLYSVIDYRPKTTLEEGLKLTIKYFVENGNKFDF